MKKTLFALCSFFLLISTTQAEVIDIDSAELARLAATGVPVIDIRTAPEWQETGVVPGSRLQTFFNEQGQVDAAGWLAQTKVLAKPEQPVILICRSGNRSQSAARFLTQQGYKTVYNVREGIRGWIREGRPLTAPPTQAACTPPKKC